MWILHLLPDSILQSIVHLILIVGILGLVLEYFLHYIPPLYQYKYVIKIISSILFISGIYFEGGYSTEMIWREKVKEAEERVKIAEAQSKITNEIIKEVVVEKVKVVKEKVMVNNTKIKTERIVIDAECTIPDVAFEIYNTAANGDIHE